MYSAKTEKGRFNFARINMSPDLQDLNNSIVNLAFPKETTLERAVFWPSWSEFLKYA